jgi:hypothetical protein
MWYAANIIMYVKFKDTAQSKYPIWENIILISADSFDEALKKAEIRGREEEGDAGGSFTWENRPAKWVFGGVRKINQCSDVMDSPGDGTEITYLQMEVDSEESLSKLVRGKPVTIYYEE